MIFISVDSYHRLRCRSAVTVAVITRVLLFCGDGGGSGGGGGGGSGGGGAAATVVAAVEGAVAVVLAAAVVLPIAERTAAQGQWCSFFTVNAVDVAMLLLSFLLLLLLLLQALLVLFCLAATI